MNDLERWGFQVVARGVKSGPLPEIELIEANNGTL